MIRVRHCGVTGPASARPVVAVAVVISDLGVLVGRRRDGNPPWTFPGGKIVPGKSPEEAAVRETPEETGLRVCATGVIGSRVHPLPGVPVAYVAATPTSELDVIGGQARCEWTRCPRSYCLQRDVSADVSTVSRPRSG